MNGKLWSDLSGLVAVAKHISWMAAVRREATKTSIILKITNFAPANSIKFSKIHSSPGRILWHATTGLASCRLFDEHDTLPGPRGGRGIFVFSLSANGAFLHQISSAGTVSGKTGEPEKDICFIWMREFLACYNLYLLDQKYLFRHHRRVTCRKPDSYRVR